MYFSRLDYNVILLIREEHEDGSFEYDMSDVYSFSTPYQMFEEAVNLVNQGFEVQCEVWARAFNDIGEDDCVDRWYFKEGENLQLEYDNFSIGLGYRVAFQDTMTAIDNQYAPDFSKFEKKL